MSDQIKIKLKNANEKLARNLVDLEKIVVSKIGQINQEKETLKQTVSELEKNNSKIKSASEMTIFEIKSDLEKIKKLINNF